MLANVFVQQCLMLKQFHSVMRIAIWHVLLIMPVSHQFFQSLKGGTALTARDYCNSRDISRKQSASNAKDKASGLVASSLCDTICICKVKTTTADRLVKCHGRFEVYLWQVLSRAMPRANEDANQSQDNLEIIAIYAAQQ